MTRCRGAWTIASGACTDMGSFSSLWRIIIQTTHRNTGRAPCFVLFYFLIAPKGRKKEKRTRGDEEMKKKERVKRYKVRSWSSLQRRRNEMYVIVQFARNTLIICPLCGIAAKNFFRTRRRKRLRPERACCWQYGVYYYGDYFLDVCSPGGLEHCLGFCDSSHLGASKEPARSPCLSEPIRNIRARQ